MNFNPFDMQKKMYEAWEKNFSGYLDKFMREPAFMKAMAKNMETTMDIHQMVKKQVRMVLKGLSIPTEESLSGLYKTVHNVETRLLDLEEKFDELSQSRGSAQAGTVPEKGKSQPKTKRAVPKKKAASAP